MTTTSCPTTTAPLTCIGSFSGACGTAPCPPGQTCIDGSSGSCECVGPPPPCYCLTGPFCGSDVHSFPTRRSSDLALCSCTGGSPPCSCVCGDGLCGPAEDCSTCPGDCGTCPTTTTATPTTTTTTTTTPCTGGSGAPTSDGTCDTGFECFGHSDTSPPYR